MKANRIEFLQQETGYQVEGLFVRFVEHIPARHYRTVNTTRNIKDDS